MSMIPAGSVLQRVYYEIAFARAGAFIMIMMPEIMQVAQIADGIIAEMYVFNFEVLFFMVVVWAIFCLVVSR